MTGGDPIDYPNDTDILYPDTDNILWPGTVTPQSPSYRTGTAAAGSTSILNIWNRACAAIGTRTTIASLTEDSNEARQCALLYDGVRDQLLSTARWNFARGMAALTLVKAVPGTPERPSAANSPTRWNATMPQIPWLYSYAYPAEAIVIQRIPLQVTVFNGDVPLTTAPSPTWFPYQNPVVSARFQVAQDIDPVTGNPFKNILTNVPQAVGVFTRETTDTTVFDSQFTEALVMALAGRLAIPLTGDKTMEKNKYAIANNFILQARTSDGNEGISTADHLPDWISIRAGGSGYGADNNLGILCEPYGALFGAGNF